MSYQSTKYAIDDTWTWDFETYYDDEYSLKKMSMEAYIRDPLFLCHGLSVKRGERPSIWIAGHDRVQRFISGVNFSGKIIIGQNSKFDGLISHDIFGAKGIVWRDTASMAPGVGSDRRSSSSVTDPIGARENDDGPGLFRGMDCVLFACRWAHCATAAAGLQRKDGP